MFPGWNKDGRIITGTESALTKQRLQDQSRVQVSSYLGIYSDTKDKSCPKTEITEYGPVALKRAPVLMNG